MHRVLTHAKGNLLFFVPSFTFWIALSVDEEKNKAVCRISACQQQNDRPFLSFYSAHLSSDFLSFQTIDSKIWKWKKYLRLIVRHQSYAIFETLLLFSNEYNKFERSFVCIRSAVPGRKRRKANDWINTRLSSIVCTFFYYFTAARWIV